MVIVKVVVICVVLYNKIVFLILYLSKNTYSPHRSSVLLWWDL